MVGADRPGIKVLEVGCASGVGSIICASNILAKKTEDTPGSVLVTLDFAEDFIKMTNSGFAESDFAQVSSNIVDIDTETDYVSNGE